MTAPRSDVDLRDRSEVDAFLKDRKPDAIFLAAAKVGGIHANERMPADFIYDNLAIQTNIIAAARNHGARKLLFLGSSCVYPRLAPQPITEDRPWLRNNRPNITRNTDRAVGQYEFSRVSRFCAMRRRYVLQLGPDRLGLH